MQGSDDDDDATVGNEDDRMTARHRAIIRKAEYHCGAFDVPVLTAQELIALREKDDAGIVGDVRTEAERRVARLPRSVSRCYFEQALRLNADAASLRGVKIVVICTVGRRSGHYARQLVMRGCENVFNSQGIVAYSHHHLASGAGPHALVDEERRPATRGSEYGSHKEGGEAMSGDAGETPMLPNLNRPTTPRAHDSWSTVSRLA